MSEGGRKAIRADEEVASLSRLNAGAQEGRNHAVVHAHPGQPEHVSDSLPRRRRLQIVGSL